MTMNGHFASKSVSGSATNGLASPAFGQNCSKICRATHILSATKMQPRERSFRQYEVYVGYTRGFAREGALNESGVVENGDFRFIRSLYSEHFTYMATRQLSGDTTVDDLGHISRSLDCFTSNFSTVCDTAKVTIGY